MALSLLDVNITQSCVSSAARCPSHPFCSSSWIPAASCSTDHWMAGAVWLGGEALADHLLTTPALVRGARVLELGGGTGIVGLAAVLAGAAEVSYAPVVTRACKQPMPAAGVKRR
eukprot:5014824-Prymnesium_polylepis.1